MKHYMINKTSIILIGLFLITTLLMMMPSYQLLVKPRGQAFDLFWIWAGGQAILTGENPYGPETTQTIQLGVFKKIIPPHEYQHGFPHPAHIAFVLLPFVAVPFSWSVLVWLALQIPLFMVILILGFELLQWKVRPVELFFLPLLTTLGFRYPINVYVLAQIHFFILLFFVLSTWLYRHGHPRWAAVVLACATIRPDLALPALVLALILIRKSPRQKEFMVTLLITGVVFLFLPAFFIGFWPITWINAIRSYGSNPFATWPPELLPSLWLRFALITGLVIWAGRYILQAWKNPIRYTQSLMISAVVLISLIIFPQTGSYSLTFALISALILMRHAQPRLKMIIALSLLMPWIYFALGETFHTLIYLLIPGQFIIFQEMVAHNRQKLTTKSLSSPPRKPRNPQQSNSTNASRLFHEQQPQWPAA